MVRPTLSYRAPANTAVAAKLPSSYGLHAVEKCAPPRKPASATCRNERIRRRNAYATR